MKIITVDQVSINVFDMAKSFDFYGRVLGLKQQQKIDSGEFDITYFGLPDGSQLELFDFHDKNRYVSHAESEVGFRLLAFQAAGVAAAVPPIHAHQRKQKNDLIRDLTHPNPPFPEREGREKEGFLHKILFVPRR